MIFDPKIKIFMNKTFQNFGVDFGRKSQVMDCRVALVVLGLGVGALVQKQADHVVIASICEHHKGRATFQILEVDIGLLAWS
jgi:hypothetical protein